MDRHFFQHLQRAQIFDAFEASGSFDDRPPYRERARRLASADAQCVIHIPPNGAIRWPRSNARTSPQVGSGPPQTRHLAPNDIILTRETNNFRYTDDNAARTPGCVSDARLDHVPPHA